MAENNEVVGGGIQLSLEKLIANKKDEVGKLKITHPL